MARTRADRRKALEAFVEHGAGFYPAGPPAGDAAAPEPPDGRPSPGAEWLGGAAWFRPGEDGTERLTVPLPRKIAAGAKAAAARRGMTLAEFTARALKREIKRTHKKLDDA
jgi:hypothetical protein